MPKLKGISGPFSLKKIIKFIKNKMKIKNEIRDNKKRIPNSLLPTPVNLDLPYNIISSKITSKQPCRQPSGYP